MWVLYNVAHANSRIKSFDGKAWLRVLGFFHSEKKAREHAKEIDNSINSGLEIRICRTEQFRIILNVNYSNTEEENVKKIKEKEEKKLDFLLKYHKELLKKRKEEVETNSRDKKIGEVFFCPEERRKIYNELHNEIEIQKKGQVKNIQEFEGNERQDIVENVQKNGLDIQNSEGLLHIKKNFSISTQNYFSVAFLPDYETNLFDTVALDTWKMQYEKNFLELQNKELSEFFSDVLHLKNKYISFHEFVKEGGEKKEETFSNKMYYEHTKEKYIDFIETIIKNENNIEYYQKYKKIILNINEKQKIWKDLNPVPDFYEKDEPAIAFLSFGETSQEVHDYILKNKNSTYMKEFDVACIAMYEWINLENFKNPLIKKEYREEMLDTLLKNRDVHLETSEHLKKEHPNLPIIDVF